MPWAPLWWRRKNSLAKTKNCDLQFLQLVFCAPYKTQRLTEQLHQYSALLLQQFGRIAPAPSLVTKLSYCDTTVRHFDRIRTLPCNIYKTSSSDSSRYKKGFVGQFVLMRFRLLLSEFFFYPLLDRARYRDRCWAAIRLSHRPEPSGRAVHGQVDGLDIGEHGPWFILLRHTHRPQRRPYPICSLQAGAETSETGAEAVAPDPGSSWEGHSGGMCTSVCNWNAESCGVLRPLRIPLMIRPLHRTYVVVVRKTDELLCGRYKWVSRFEAPCSCTRWMGERWVQQVSKLHGTAS